MLVMGHRGWASEYPENTLLSFRKSLELGIDIIEFDVRPCASGELVVLHDESVDRTTDGKGLVSSLSLLELKRLDAGSWKSPDFAGERIPSLDETLDLLKAFPDVLLNVEIKGSSKETARSSIDALAAKGLLARSYFTCFDPAVLDFVKSVDPALKTQGFPSWMMKGFRRGKEGTYSKMDYVGIWLGDADERLVTFFKDIGVTPGAWCADDEAAVDKCASLEGLEILTSNAPGLAIARLKELGAR